VTVSVRIPTQLRSLTGGVSEVTATGATVGDLILDLDRRYPGISDRLLEGGEVRRFVNVYVNGEDVRFLEGAATTLPPAASVAIIPAVAGG
jgi:sulfur-carrier protein